MKHVVKKGFKPKDHNRGSAVNGTVNGVTKVKDGRFQKIIDAGEECALSFPDLRIITKSKMPCMASILSRSKEENINMADLNQLQEELETMLSSVIIRKMNLNNEIDILNNMEDKKGSLPISSVLLRSKEENANVADFNHLQGELETMLSSVVVRNINLNNDVETHSNMEDKKGSLPISNKTNQNKKSEDRSLLKIGKPLKDPRNLTGTHKSKLKSSSVGCTDSEALSDADGITSALAKMNDTANKFWAYVEQFCGDISTEDVKLLKELIENCEKEAQVRKIPPLGKHYSLTWSEEDIADERDVTKMKRKADGTPAITCTTTNADSKETKEFLKKAEKICLKDRIPGPLAQRMISAIMEENPSFTALTQCQGNGSRIKVIDDEPVIKRPKLELSSDMVLSENKGGENTVPNSLKKIPLLHSSVCFERNARKNLELIGFLDSPSLQEENDEILAEIKKCQEELKSTAMKNLVIYRKLLKKAEAELARAPLRNEMKQVDAEIVEIYKKIADTKLKKKLVGEKVKKQAWKLIKDREQLQKQLDALAPELTV